MKITDKHAFFFTDKDIFSNFYPCTIKAYKQVFPSSEHYFMFEKALFFKDYETAQKILTAPTPLDAKKLGREVKGFNKEVWDKVSIKYMKRVCFDKFIQNPHLQTAFKEAKGKTIVEASPHDKLWGIGLSMEDPLANIESNWLGLNQLGQVLKRVGEMIDEYNAIPEEPVCPPDPDSPPAYVKKPRVSMADSLSSSAFKAPEPKKYTPPAPVSSTINPAPLVKPQAPSSPLPMTSPVENDEVPDFFDESSFASNAQEETGQKPPETIDASAPVKKSFSFSFTPPKK